MNIFWQYALIFAVFIALSLLNMGIITKVKAFFGGRKGAPVLQKLYDIIKLWQKDITLSTTTSWIFFAGPFLSVLVPLIAFAMVPFGSVHALISFEGDFILFLYLFALLRFFTVASALDTGSSFEGMGGAREITFSVLIEPILFVCFIILAKISNSLALENLFGIHSFTSWTHDSTVLTIVVFSLFVVMLAENSRVPFDDPNTHLELTMVHEVMVLDHSGPLLGLITLGSALKLTLFALLISHLLLPLHTDIFWLDLVLSAFVSMGVVACVGICESLIARLRIVAIKNILLGTFVIALFGIIMITRQSL
ncbi:MAG: NADH-quinone oxidoreductase subunit H [Sulfurospirillum sp.]|nr:NADH-quinone oxidoreductase subunit H [Sulfurospirillum sp.]